MSKNGNVMPWQEALEMAAVWYEQAATLGRLRAFLMARYGRHVNYVAVAGWLRREQEIAYSEFEAQIEFAIGDYEALTGKEE